MHRGLARVIEAAFTAVRRPVCVQFRQQFVQQQSQQKFQQQ